MGLVLTTSAFAQAKKGAKSEKMTNVQGKVGKVDKDTITVLVGTTPKPVMINSDTKFLMGHSNDNKPGSVSDVKQGNFIACSGSLDAKSQFTAKQCVYRDKQ
jgi:hypothetical protein